MKTRWYCLFCDQWDRSNGRGKAQYLFISISGHQCNTSSQLKLPLGQAIMQIHVCALFWHPFVGGETVAAPLKFLPFVPL